MVEVPYRHHPFHRVHYALKEDVFQSVFVSFLKNPEVRYVGLDDELPRPIPIRNLYLGMG